MIGLLNALCILGWIASGLWLAHVRSVEHIARNADGWQHTADAYAEQLDEIAEIVEREPPKRARDAIRHLLQLPFSEWPK